MRPAGSVALAAIIGLLPALASAAEITLAWDPNDPTEGVEGYKLYYGDQPDPPFNGKNAKQGRSPIKIPLSVLGNPENPSFTVTGLTTCQKFFFRLTAYNDKGESKFSNTASTTVAPKARGVKVMGAGSGGAFISWDGLNPVDLPHLNQVRVHYAFDTGEPYDGTGASQGASPITISPTATEMYLTGLEPAKAIHVVVEPRCPNGEGRMSKETMGLTGDGEADVPYILQGGCRIANADGHTPALPWLLLLGLLALRLTACRRT